MGNKVCCEETRTKTHFETQKPLIIKSTNEEHLIKPVSVIKHQLKISNTDKSKEDIKIPELTHQIIEVLKTKKYFQTEQTKQSNPSVRRYGEDVYAGDLDQKGLKPNGFGKIYKKDKCFYIGYFKYGKAEGKGAFIYPDGSNYYGDFHNNCTESKNGEFTSNTLNYKGGFSNNVFEGQGYEQSRQYNFKGIFHQGRRTKGTLYWTKDNHSYTYEVQFNQYNQFHGKGTLKQPQGRYQGHFHNGEKHGYGTYQYQPKGLKYAGTYVHNVREGQGIIYHSSGKIAYKGAIKDGLPHGKGFLYTNQGNRIEAEWVYGLDKSNLAD